MAKSGILLIDKPAGITSHDVVARIRSALKTRSVGHAGTLDPLATGLLIILLKEATKLSNYLLNENKTYEVLVRFGIETDSWDVDGKVIEKKQVCLNPNLIEQQALQLEGQHTLSVPSLSAIKVNGKKLYDYARKDGDFKVVQREMSFYGYKTLEVGTDHLRARISCKKGGYIRSWSHYLGKALGTSGVVEELRRVQSDPYHIKQAITLKNFLEKNSPSNDDTSLNHKQDHFIPIQECLPNWKGVTVRGRDQRLMSNGKIPNGVLTRLNFEQKQVNKSNKNMGIKVIDANESLLSLMELQPFSKPKVCRVFNEV